MRLTNAIGNENIWFTFASTFHVWPLSDLCYQGGKGPFVFTTLKNELFSAQNASIGIKNHDLLLEVDDHANLTFQVSNLQHPLTVTFSGQAPILNVTPASVHLTPESSSFSVGIEAAEAGKTTVTVNVSSAK